MVFTDADQIRDAPAPFDDHAADLILRSSDNVDFRVHRQVLAVASPVFADMFDLPPPSPDIGGSVDERRNGLIVVDMAEDERALRLLLGFCYPVMEPALEDLELVKLALRLAQKFQMLQSVARYVQPGLKLLAADAPEQVYAVASAYELRAVALVAARASLSRPILTKGRIPLYPEFTDVSGFDVLRLLRFQQACSERAVDAVTDLRWLRRVEIPFKDAYKGYGLVWQTCDVGDKCTHALAHVPLKLEDAWTFKPKPWVMTYLETARAALHDSANSAVLARFDTLRPAFEEAALCASCGKIAASALPNFSRLLTARVENAISQVELETAL
ncbi:hypothetical protein PENSPDRAFT_431333 [Peniophora sp. CONT]|nr:hypothetical protein PENSPDRAFT_431333 [Peniophora sp. CONT]